MPDNQRDNHSPGKSESLERSNGLQRRQFLTLGAAALGGLAVARPVLAESVPKVPTAASIGGASRFFPGFTASTVTTSGAAINTLHGGQGPALLLLHGHPQTLVCWHKIAQQLARHFTVVLTDLRGYGDSSKPDGGANHIGYSKRAMAQDQIEVMRTLGHDRFQVAGHDRGGRVVHRMALDHPEVVERAAVLDIAPTATMYARTDKEFATRYFWWFFNIQPAPLPERMIGADPEFYLNGHLIRQNKTPDSIPPEVFAEYRRCYTEATIHAVMEDYRAAAGIDLEHDAADADKRIQAPLLALWGAKGVVGKTYDVLATWREKAVDVQGTALPCGHYLAEEAPDETVEELLGFFRTA